MLGITMGDAAGVGPEILLKAFAAGELPGRFIAAGDYEILAACNEMLALGVPIRRAAGCDACRPNALNVCDLGLLGRTDLAVGRVSKQAGHAALMYVQRATRLALDGGIDAVVTLPMNKEATRLSHPDFTGHTEFIAGLCRCADYAMMLAGERLIVTHVSTHVSQRVAIEQVKADRVYTVIRLTADAAATLRGSARIAVAGLNPHAGEGGAFGTEEADEIAPAVARATADGLDVVGPVAPDTVFHRAAAGRYDAVVCMYHDQGHIPMKLLDFEGAVNVTLGLPIVRTSVDHGTAFDIAYQGTASTRSFANACKLATRLARA